MHCVVFFSETLTGGRQRISLNLTVSGPTWVTDLCFIETQIHIVKVDVACITVC